MKETDFYEVLLNRVFPYLQRNYDIAMLKKELSRLDRYRTRLCERIKELEQKNKDENGEF